MMFDVNGPVDGDTDDETASANCAHGLRSHTADGVLAASPLWLTKIISLP